MGTLKCLAYINTYKRYDSTLAMSILSVINQTKQPDHFIIFDDNPDDSFVDMRQKEHLNYLFALMNQKGISWEVIYGQKKGAHNNHELANTRGFEYAWFIDDDCVAESKCLEKLIEEMNPDVGAVGGLILKPPATPLPNWLKSNKIDELYNGENIQWHTWAGQPKEVEHIYSSFLYRCNIVHHDLRLSRKVFRGETMFTHSLFLKGYKLIVTPDAITWHFESSGGCRSVEQDKTNQEMYANDEQIFRDWLNFQREKKKLYVLNGGLGDHYMFRQVITPEPDSIIACCFPNAFPEYKVISIAEAERLVDIKDYDVYAWSERNNWKGHLKDAYLKMYETLNNKRK